MGPILQIKKWSHYFVIVPVGLNYRTTRCRYCNVWHITKHTGLFDIIRECFVMRIYGEQKKNLFCRHFIREEYEERDKGGRKRERYRKRENSCQTKFSSFILIMKQSENYAKQSSFCQTSYIFIHFQNDNILTRMPNKFLMSSFSP